MVSFTDWPALTVLDVADRVAGSMAEKQVAFIRANLVHAEAFISG